MPGWARVEQRSTALSGEDAAFLTALRGFLALHRGDPESAFALVASAKRMLGDGRGKHYWLAQTPIVVCHAHILLADATGTQRTVEEARRASLVSPFVDTVRFPGYLSWAAVLNGDLAEGERQAELALEMARDVDERNVALVLPRLSLAAIALERDELATASAQLEVALDRAEESGRPPFIFISTLELARLSAAQGDRDRALEILERARSIMPDAKRVVTDQVDRLEARIAVMRGDQIAPELVEGLLPTVEQTFLRARLALAGGDPLSARRLIEATVHAGASRRRRIEHELLLARALSSRDRAGALARLAAALRLAEPVGMVRIMLEEGPEVHALLEAVPTDARMGRFVASVLNAAYGRAMPASRGATRALVEPLSEREVGVLRYLASRLTYNEIASDLFISVNTLKSHVKAIFRKLGASTRSEAVDNARRSGLL